MDNNKYLVKVAKYHYVISNNYDHNPYDSVRADRMYSIDEGNRILRDSGYIPSLTETSVGTVNAERLRDMSFAATLRPHEGSSNLKAALGGLLSGAAVGTGTYYGAMASGVNPLISAITAGAVGIGTGLLAGSTIKNWSYDDVKRKSDDEDIEFHTNRLLSHLSKNYRKE